MVDHALVPDDTPLVSSEWLERHLDDPRLRIVDTRGRIVPPGGALPAVKEQDYEAAHIPGALFVRWNEDFVDRSDPVPNQLAPPETFAQRAGELGIGDEHLVVAYDDSHNIFAARLWWAMRANGHDAVRVLDGGWTSWQTEQRATTQQVPDHPPATFTSRRRPHLRLLLDELLRARECDATVLDARSRERFAGVGGDAVGGHIPGARNVPYAELVDERTQRFRDPTMLREVLGRAGIDPESTPGKIVSYCGSGISASVPLIALELLGVREGAVYDGSWSEWSSQPELPVEQGSS